MIRRLPTLLALALFAAVPLAGCGGSTTQTTTTSLQGAGTASVASTGAAGSANAGAPSRQTKPAPAPAASAGAVEQPQSTSWDTVRCNQALIVWYKGHSSGNSKEAAAYKQTLAKHHGCFTASSHTPVASVTSWTSVRCNNAVIAWYKGHSGASSKEADAYKRTLATQHGCFTASSPISTTVSAGAWTSVQCNRTLLVWYKQHLHAGKAEVSAYKHSLATAHGCFTALSHEG